MPTANTLMEHLLEQVEFLRTHAASFDAGKEHFAKPIAHVLRTLLHQTSKSTALLTRLEARDQIQWLDSAGEVDERNPMARITIVATEVSTVMGEDAAGQLTPTHVEARHSAPLEPTRWVLPSVGAQVADLLRLGRKPRRPGEWLPFHDWWVDEAIAIDKDGKRFSRRDLVLAMAHKEGGSHVDPEMDEAYVKLTRANGLGYFFGTVGFEHDLRAEADPVPAAIRQIAYEVEMSLNRRYPELGAT